MYFSTLFSNDFLVIEQTIGILFFLAIFKPFALLLLEITAAILNEQFFLWENFINDSKLEPLPDIKIAVLIIFN